MSRPHQSRTIRPRVQQPPTVATGDCREDVSATFQARLKTGDYDALLGRGLRRALRAAAADQTLDLEIGALRIALARLLQEEKDTTRFATTVAQVASVALQAAALRPGPPSEMDELRAAFELAFVLPPEEPVPPGDHRPSPDGTVDPLSLPAGDP
jgi:hypothetical protein